MVSGKAILGVAVIVIVLLSSKKSTGIFLFFSKDTYSRLSLFRIPRDSQKYFSTFQICRIEETIIQTTAFNKYMCNWTLEVRDTL